MILVIFSGGMNGNYVGNVFSQLFFLWAAI
jgi:hypothetical protein